MGTKKSKIEALDLRIINGLRRVFLPAARISLFLVFFWFGLIKILQFSPANPLAQALTEKTIGLQYFDTLFLLLAILECVIGILFLFPKLTRVVIPLLMIHMLVVCSPLMLLPDMTWQQFLVPTLEGQYIIKNAVVVALAIGIAALTEPIIGRRTR